ncbi:uncharacterized protein [Apostichopus japonicus]|uniref:uncharacterized protein isoform X2 n=1 Tax=Stichopus japonicus TaxID=307972 RepID=UPI003AB4F8AE
MEETLSKREKEEGFAALFNEFVGKAHGSTGSSPANTQRLAVSNTEDILKEGKPTKTEKQSNEGEGVAMETDPPPSSSSSSVGGDTSVSSGGPSVPSTSKKIQSVVSGKEAKVASVSGDSLEDNAKQLPAEKRDGQADVTGKASDGRSHAEQRDRQSESVQQPISLQSSSPVPSSRCSSSSYQTSPCSSFSSSASVTPSSSPLTQPKSSVISAASSRLAKSALRIPPKREKPVLRDRAGRKRNNSLDSEFVTDFGFKRERSKSAGQSSKFKPEKEGPRYRNQKPKFPFAKPSTDRKKPRAKVYRSGIEFVPGFKLEAMDFCQNKWYLAKVVQVDEDEQQVLIHFDKWNSRYDEWVSCDSERLRPLIRQSTRKEILQPHPTGDFKYGEEVLARWSDCRYYPAKVLSVNKNGTYRMLFYDGIEKNVLASNTRVMPDELKAQNFFSNFNLPPTPPGRGKRRWFAKDTTTQGTPQPVPIEIPPESPSPTGSTKRRLSGSISPLTPPVVPPKKFKVEEKVKSPREVKPAAKQKVETPPPVVEAPTSTPLPQVLNDKDLGLLRDRPRKFLAPKELVIDLDHNKYKCDVKGCDKSFRKESLLEYHTKYYHATKTSTSSAASRVLNRTKRMISGSGKHPSKVSPRKRLSAPADLVSNFQNRMVERGGQKKRLKSPPGVVQRRQGQSSPPGVVRKKSRVRHQSEPIKAQNDHAGREIPVKSYTSEDGSKGVAREPLLTVGRASKESSMVKADTKRYKVEETVKSEAKEMYSLEAKHRTSGEATRPPFSKQAVSGSGSSPSGKGKERGHRSKDLKSVLAEVRLVEEGIKKEEERHKHRRKHKKNKDKKRRKKKKKEKKRRMKNKSKMGGDDSDEETETDEDEHVRLDEEQGGTSEDSPARVMFKQPNTGSISRRKNIFRSSSVGVDDDVVKCVCKITAEEGFMIQCEFCNCWQHSTCVGLSATTIPKKYMCYYCQIAQGAKPHFYDSEDYAWHEKGYLPRMPEFGKGPRSDDRQAASFRLATNALIGDVLTIAEVLQGLQHKIAILQNPEHPEAKLWARDWISRFQKKAELTALVKSSSDSGLGGILGGILAMGKLQFPGVTLSPSESVSAGSTVAQTGAGESSSMGDVIAQSGSSSVAQSSQSSSAVVGPPSESRPISEKSEAKERQESNTGDATPDSVAGCSSSNIATPTILKPGVAESKIAGDELLSSQATTNKDMSETVSGKDSISTEVKEPSKMPQNSTDGGDSKVEGATKEVATQGGDGKQVDESQSRTGGKTSTAVASSEITRTQGATVAITEVSGNDDSSKSVASRASDLQTDGVSLPSSSGSSSQKLVASNTKFIVLKPMNQGKLPAKPDQGLLASATSHSPFTSNAASTSKDVSSTSGTGQILSSPERSLASNTSTTQQSSGSQETDEQGPNQKTKVVDSTQESSFPLKSGLTNKEGPEETQIHQAPKSGQASAVSNTGPGQASAVSNTGPGQASDVPNTGPGQASGVLNTGPGQASGVSNTGPGQALGVPNTGPGQASGVSNTGPGQALDVPNNSQNTNSGQVSDVSNTGPGQASDVANTGPGQALDVSNTGQNTRPPSGLPAGSNVAKSTASDVVGEKSAEMQISGGDSSMSSREGNRMTLSMEDVIRNQMDLGTTSSAHPANISKDATTPHISMKSGGDVNTDNTASKVKEESSSTLPAPGRSTPGQPTRSDVVVQEPTVELSQAYLLRHINTLHNQLSERLTLIEMEVEKLEKTFASSASGWNAASEDPIVTRKRLRLLLGDLQKISNIVSI